MFFMLNEKLNFMKFHPKIRLFFLVRFELKPEIYYPTKIVYGAYMNLD